MEIQLPVRGRVWGVIQRTKLFLSRQVEGFGKWRLGATEGRKRVLGEEERAVGMG